MVSCRAPYPIFRVLNSKKSVLQGFGIDNIGFPGRHHQKKAFFGQKWPKMPLFWPKTVFLGPEWSQVGPHTLFSGFWTQKNVFCSVLEQMIKGFEATITKKPLLLPKKSHFFGLKQHFWGMSGPL